MKIFKRRFIKDRLEEKGFSSILVMTIITIVLTMLSIGITRTNLLGFKSLELLKNTRKSYYLAESGLEDSIFLLYENVRYPGDPTGIVTPIGTYYSDINSIGELYSVLSWADERETRRKLLLNASIEYSEAAIVTKATYMSDFFVIRGEGSHIRGDVWTNDDFRVGEYALVEGNLAAAGKGSQAVNWIWDGVVGGDPNIDGGDIVDNPTTTEIVEGNVLVWDTVHISGSGSWVENDVTSNENVEIMFGAQVGGTVTEDADTEWDEIPVPVFNYADYKADAVEKGTYFANQQGFLAYLNSLDDGEERRLPEDLYYVENGAVKIDGGTPVYLDGLLVVEDNLYIQCEWHQTALNDLPALVAGKDINIINEGVPAGDVRITGIVYANKRIDLYRLFEDEDIIIDGAVWAGDDIFIEENTYVIYNVDVQFVQGFGFVNGITDIDKNNWAESLD